MNIYVIHFVDDLQQVRDFALGQFSGFVQVILMFNATGLITKDIKILDRVDIIFNL